MKPSIGVLVVAIALAPRGLAAQSLDSTITVHSGARFELSSRSGTVRVRAWNRPQQIRVQAQSDGARVDLDASASRVSVRAVPRRGEGDVEFTISVPVGTPLEVHAISADIDVMSVCGEARLGSISGGVTLVCANGDAEVESVSGDVSASDITGRAEISSTSGDVEVRQVKGDLSARSVSGDVTLDRVDGNDVAVETVSGGIGFTGPIHDNGRYRFRSHSGDVTVHPAGDLNAVVGVSTYSGDLESDWPITLNPGGRMHSREWEFTVGSGSARLNLESFSGTIYLRRGAAPRRED
jgi:DUF4097 and DUF4098 domain-containing protein YvlB